MHFEFTLSERMIHLLQMLVFCPIATYLAGLVSMVFASRHINAITYQCSCRTAPRYMKVGFIFGLAISICLSALVVLGYASWSMTLLWFAAANVVFGLILMAWGRSIGETRSH